MNRIMRSAIGAVLLEKTDETGAAATGGGAAAKAAEKVKAEVKAAEQVLMASGGGSVARASAEERAAVEKAEKLEADAAKALADAARAAVVAKQKQEAAAAARAEAEGRVLCTIPARFGVMIAGKRIQVEAGIHALTREVANHAYSKAQGVKIVGFPSTKA